MDLIGKMHGAVCVGTLAEGTLGGAIVGPSAGDLVAEISLAIEMGADAADIGLTVHPHPTLSETEGETADIFLGSATHILPKT